MREREEDHLLMLEFWFSKYLLGCLGKGEPVAQLQPLKALKAFNGFKLLLTDNILLFLQKIVPRQKILYFEMLLKNILLCTMCNMPVTIAYKGSIQNIITYIYE